MDEENVQEGQRRTPWPPPSDWSLSPVVLESDFVFTMLAHPRRRYVCYRLVERSEWSLDTLATRIAAWEADVPADAVADEAEEEVYVSLYHSHVPKLVDADVVTFDADAETITPAENAQLVFAALVGAGAGLQTKREMHLRE